MHHIYNKCDLRNGHCVCTIVLRNECEQAHVFVILHTFVEQDALR